MKEYFTVTVQYVANVANSSLNKMTIHTKSEYSLHKLTSGTVSQFVYSRNIKALLLEARVLAQTSTVSR